MTIIQSGRNDGFLLGVDPIFKAFDASYRPIEALGYYRINLLSGTMTATGGAIIFGFRNPSANLHIITDVRIGFLGIAGNTAASWVVSLWATRSYTVLDTTGAATVPTLGMNLSSSRNRQSEALMAISNTGALSGGTGTDDTQPLSSLVFQNPGNIGPQGDVTIGNHTQSFFTNFSGMQYVTYPLVCATSEGFRIRADTASGGGTDTQALYVDVEWIEATAF